MVATFIYSRQIWYGFEPMYNFFMRIGPVLAILYFTVGYLILILYYFNQLFKYMDEIIESVEMVNSNDNELISLDEDLLHLETKLNQMKFNLQESQRIAKAEEQRKNDLIVYLAHDIKTPLTSVIGYLSLLEEVKDMPSAQREKYTQVVLDKAYRLEDLINELFDIARYNDGSMTLMKEEIDLNLLLQQMSDDFYPKLQELNKSIKINNYQDISLMVDSDKIARVFNNVLNNAITYSYKNSEIIINTFVKNSNIIVSIENEGPQISNEKLQRIFEKFYRLNSARSSSDGGSGLGLAIAKDIVELHNGTISVKSEGNKTTFLITLPRT